MQTSLPFFVGKIAGARQCQHRIDRLVGFSFWHEAVRFFPGSSEPSHWCRRPDSSPAAGSPQPRVRSWTRRVLAGNFRDFHCKANRGDAGRRRAELCNGRGDCPSPRSIDRIRRGRDPPRQKTGARRCVSLDLKQHRIDYPGCGEPKLQSVRCWTFFCRSKERAPLAQTGPDPIRSTRKCRISVCLLRSLRLYY